MSRPRSSIPKLCHHRASGQAKVRLNGHDRYLGRWGSKEARQAYARLVSEIAVGGHSAISVAAQSAANSNTISVAELCHAWLENAEKTYTFNGKPTSVIGRFKTPIRVLRELYGLTQAAAFGPLALEVVRNEFVKLGMSRGICNAYCGNVRRIFRWGVSRELIPPSIATALATLEPLKMGRTTAPEPKRVHPVSDAIIEATLPHLPAIVSDMVRLQRATGMRPGEVCALRPSEIDRSGEVWRYEPKFHKTQHYGNQRVVWIGPQGQSVLSKYLHRPDNSYCFSPAEAMGQIRKIRHLARKTPLSAGNRPGMSKLRKPRRIPGDRYTSDTYGKAITRACEAAFDKPDNMSAEEAAAWRAKYCWRPNQLRHTFATVARQVGGIESVQALLGHSRIGTSQIYAERLNALAASVAAKIG